MTWATVNRLQQDQDASAGPSFSRRTAPGRRAPRPALNKLRDVLRIKANVEHCCPKELPFSNTQTPLSAAGRDKLSADLPTRYVTTTAQVEAICNKGLGAKKNGINFYL